MQCIVLPHITASVFINDDAGPWVGCTTAPTKLASGKPLSWTKGQVADAHLKRHGLPSEAAGAKHVNVLQHLRSTASLR